MKQAIHCTSARIRRRRSCASSARVVFVCSRHWDRIVARSNSEISPRATCTLSMLFASSSHALKRAFSTIDRTRSVSRKVPITSGLSRSAYSFSYAFRRCGNKSLHPAFQKITDGMYCLYQLIFLFFLKKSSVPLLQAQPCT